LALFVGYFEGLDSERGVAWRAADSLTLRDFHGLALHDAPPDHSTISRTRRLIDSETHQQVFTWVLDTRRAACGGRTCGVRTTSSNDDARRAAAIRCAVEMEAGADQLRGRGKAT
jgi:transposase